MTIKILNEGLRDHLTKYQARFRKWYDLESEKSENFLLEPQEIQKKYDNYNDLISDLKSVNLVLIQYSNELNNLIKG